MLERCAADPTLPRAEAGPLACPLGVYPIEPLEPVCGYSVRFEAADGDDEDGEWEEWPDRYVFEIVAPATRLPALWRTLASLLPPRVYPILDVMGHDAYREVDPYIAYDLVGLDQVIDATQRYGPYLLEDGLVGFGSMCDDPFGYVFVDEHKILTVRCLPEQKERIEAALAAFDLEQVPAAVGVDAVAHEHRGVLVTPEDQPELLSAEEIVERLRDTWALTLNIDSETNIDDEGKSLGTTAWRLLVRVQEAPEDEDATPPPPPIRYAEIYLHAASLREAEDLAYEAVGDLVERSAPGGRSGSSARTDASDNDPLPPDAFIIAADRVLPEAFAELLAAAGERSGRRIRQGVSRVCAARWSL